MKPFLTKKNSHLNLKFFEQAFTAVPQLGWSFFAYLVDTMKPTAEGSVKNFQRLQASELVSVLLKKNPVEEEGF